MHFSKWQNLLSFLICPQQSDYKQTHVDWGPLVSQQWPDSKEVKVKTESQNIMIRPSEKASGEQCSEERGFCHPGNTPDCLQTFWLSQPGLGAGQLFTAMGRGQRSQEVARHPVCTETHLAAKHYPSQDVNRTTGKKAWWCVQWGHRRHCLTPPKENPTTHVKDQEGGKDRTGDDNRTLHAGSEDSNWEWGHEQSHGSERPVRPPWKQQQRQPRECWNWEILVVFPHWKSGWV